MVTIECHDPAEIVERLRRTLGVEARIAANGVHFELDDAHQRVVEVVAALGDSIRSITVARPTLEDVFLRRTGRRLSEAGDPGGGA